MDDIKEKLLAAWVSFKGWPRKKQAVVVVALLVVLVLLSKCAGAPVPGFDPSPGG